MNWQHIDKAASLKANQIVLIYRPVFDAEPYTQYMVQSGDFVATNAKLLGYTKFWIIE